MLRCRGCPVPLTVRGTRALVSFAPLAFELFYAARHNAVLRRSPFPPLATTTYETFLGLMMTEARRVKDKRDSKLDTIDEDEEKSGHK